MAELDQQFIEYVVKNLVDHPDDVKLERSIDDRGVLLELTVNEEDMGRIIGKAGSTAKAIRTLLRVVGAKTDERLNLKIVDVGGEGESDSGPVDASAEEVAEEVEAPAAAAEEPLAETPAEGAPQPDSTPSETVSLEELGATEEEVDSLKNPEANTENDVEAKKAKARKDIEDIDLDIK